MSYQYLDHEADIGLEASGATLAEALQAGVQGLLDLMVDTRTVCPVSSTPVTVEASDLGALYVALLNAVLAERDLSGQFFHDIEITQVTATEKGWHVDGILHGEPAEPDRHEVGTEVKAATYAGLRVVESPSRVALRCVLDI